MGGFGMGLKGRSQLPQACGFEKCQLEGRPHFSATFHLALYLLIVMAPLKYRQGYSLFNGSQNKEGGILIHKDSLSVMEGVCRG